MGKGFKVEVEFEIPEELFEEMKKYSINWPEFVRGCIYDRLQEEHPLDRPRAKH
jgi:hypothetical protein